MEFARGPIRMGVLSGIISKDQFHCKRVIHADPYRIFVITFGSFNKVLRQNDAQRCA